MSCRETDLANTSGENDCVDVAFKRAHTTVQSPPLPQNVMLQTTRLHSDPEGRIHISQ